MTLLKRARVYLCMHISQPGSEQGRSPNDIGEEERHLRGLAQSTNYSARPLSILVSNLPTYIISSPAEAFGLDGSGRAWPGREGGGSLLAAHL